MPQLTPEGTTETPTYDFASAINARLPLIQGLGESQNNYIQQAAQRRMALSQAQAQSDWATAQAQSAATGANNSAMAGGAGNPFQRLVKGIRQQESGGNYGATNRNSGAAGAYQIMPSNLMGVNAGWDKEALGRDINLGQFYASPQIQDQIATYKLKQYYDAYGAAGAAIAWYAGPQAAARYVHGGGVSNASQGSYPTVSAYMRQLLQRMGL
jgi:muramidase (phage lysozyme)